MQYSCRSGGNINIYHLSNDGLPELRFTGHLCLLLQGTDRDQIDWLSQSSFQVTVLKTIAQYLASVIGSQVSVKSVADYMTSNGRRVSANTGDDYMEALAESFIFYPVGRFNIMGKQVLKTNQKWYMVDLGLWGHILPRRNYDLASLWKTWCILSCCAVAIR